MTHTSADTARDLGTARPGPVGRDPDEAATNTLDPRVPRPIDRPTHVPLPTLGQERLDAEAFAVAKILAAPDDPEQWEAWRSELRALAERARSRAGLDDPAIDARYAALSWTQRCRVAAQIWLWDERLYDWTTRRFTPDRLLAAYADVGGLDGLVLWHAYPCIGIDERNQFDWYRDVPGLAGLVADLQVAGVRVFLDYNPWDVSTRREPVSDGAALRALADDLGADGVFLDTLKFADQEFLAWAGGERPLALEGESRAPDERLGDHLLSWAQWFADSQAPGVMRARLVERRHMLHSVRRWNRDHAAELQSSWMNGVGVLVWDAVFGVWVGWNARDRSTLRRMSRVQRACHDLLQVGAWDPLAGATASAGTVRVYGSTFSGVTEDDGALTLVTLVNRSEKDARGPFLSPDLTSDLGSRDAPGQVSAWDVTAGTRVWDAVDVPAHGIAGVLLVRGDVPSWVSDLVAAAAADPHDVDTTFPARAADLVPFSHTPGGPPRGTLAVRVPVDRHTMERRWRRRETGVGGEAPYVEEWKPLPPRLHDQRTWSEDVELPGGVAVSAREVTHGELLTWRGAVRDCADGVSEPSGPARGVDLDEARAYAAAHGARLPTDVEWQLAAGQPGFVRLRPHVWEWTESERTDGITRRVLLKGGSETAVTGSDWYADGGEQPPEQVLAWLRTGLDKSPAIGFRLAWDLPDSRQTDHENPPREEIG